MLISIIWFTGASSLLYVGVYMSLIENVDSKSKGVINFILSVVISGVGIWMLLQGYTSYSLVLER